MTSEQPHAVVVGSINMDVSVAVPRLPRAGETLMARRIHRTGGGKGANQAVAARRASDVRTSMIGAVGRDADGTSLRESLERDGIDCSALHTVDGPTGSAFITVDDQGENTIVVVPGANDHLHLSDEATDILRSADVVLAQLEVDQHFVAAAVGARRPGVPFVLNAAPSAGLCHPLEEQVDVLVVNEHEACDLAGHRDLDAAVASLTERFETVVVTLGAAGARLDRRSQATVRVQAPRVQAVDTVAAGDTFCGVLATAITTGHTDARALELSCAASSLTVMRRGAQESIPGAAEVHDRWTACYGSR